MLTRAAPLTTKVLAACGDEEWRTVGEIAEHTGLSGVERSADRDPNDEEAAR